MSKRLLDALKNVVVTVQSEKIDENARERVLHTINKMVPLVPRRGLTPVEKLRIYEEIAGR